MVGKRQRNRHYKPPAPYFRHLGDADLFTQYSKDMLSMASSWRGYLVGGSGIGRKRNGTYLHLWGFNSKAAPGPRRRGDKCAAMRMMDEARKNDCVILEMWEAHEEPQKDDKTNLDLGHTISCVHCRAQFNTEIRKPFGCVRRGTRIHFVESGSSNRARTFTVEQILRICS